MPLWRDRLKFETCTVVANTETTFGGVRRYHEQLVKDPSTAYSLGNNVVMLSGSHGSDDGRDGLTDLLMLSSHPQYSFKNRTHVLDPTQTRGFYTEWYTKYFKEEPEDEDPRIYEDKETGKVVGINKELLPSKWKTMTKKIHDREVSFKVIWCTLQSHY